MEICAAFIKALDATVGLFMTYIDREPRRRELYGKAGAFRPKPYGVEYRTPSNAWIWNKDTRFLVHGLINAAIANQTRSPGNISKWTSGMIATEEYLQEVINTGDWQVAKDALDNNSLLRSVWGTTPLSTAWGRVVKKMEQ